MQKIRMTVKLDYVRLEILNVTTCRSKNLKKCHSKNSSFKKCHSKNLLSDIKGTQAPFLSDDNFFEWTKFKASADNILNLVKVPIAAN